MSEWADIATLAKARNLQGGFVVRSATGLPFLLEEGMEVAFVPPVLDAPRRATVSSIQQQGADAVAFFHGIEDRSTAELLAGCHCLVRRSDLPEDALIVGSGIVGWTARDLGAGFEGVVTDVLEHPGQTLLELSASDGRTVLVPLVDEFVESFDEEKRLIRLRAPSGIYDLS